MRIEPFELERWQSVHENQVEINLSESGVHPLTVRELLDSEDVAEVLDQRLVYPQTNGTEELRSLVATGFAGATPGHVEVTNGGSEANFIACWNLLDRDHEAIVMTPVYGQVPGLARAFSGRVHDWSLRFDPSTRRHRVDLDRLEDLAGDRTRLIAICNPSNPTGARLTAAELDAIGAIADRCGAHVLSDEIYRGAELDGVETDTMWGRAERVVVTGGLSKAYGLPGLRIGWVVAEPAQVDEFWKHHDYTSIAPSALSDRLARVALADDRRRALLARTRAHLNHNLPLVHDWIDAVGRVDEYAAPEAGAIAWVRIDGLSDSSAFAERVRLEERTLIVPGCQFGAEGYLRIGFGGATAEVAEGLSRVARQLARVPSR